MTKKMVAVTACITGIAHTYMAKANLEKFAKQEGYEIKVETQGAMGVENKLSEDEIAAADVVIFAVDTTVVGRDRFDGKKVYEVGTSAVVKDGDKVVEDAISAANA